ncbi:MAG: DUF2752 domain-containing protein [Phycisphaerae bacterium]|nr:DUF2752 domain-containing protein [Phycisphaerae bacterium]
MSNEQYSNSAISRPKCSPKGRLIAAGVFLAVCGAWAVLWLSANEHLNLRFWLGICGFKQRYGLPCPGCGWTHAGQLFATGHPVQAFFTQPAAAFFCAAGVAAAIYALLMAVFGIDFGFPRRLLTAVGVKWLVIGAILVLLAGWAVVLVRTISSGQ